MATFAHILAPLVMLLPVMGLIDPPREISAHPETVQSDSAQQVSIQQRVTVRVSPRPAPMPMPMMFESEMDSNRGPRFIERKIGDCLPVAAISGVQAIDNSRLLLILNDRRMITARLEKGCQGREFYSGFIVARNADAQICVGRDRLQSRSGTACQVAGFRQLIQISE